MRKSLFAYSVFIWFVNVVSCASLLLIVILALRGYPLLLMIFCVFFGTILVRSLIELVHSLILHKKEL